MSIQAVIFDLGGVIVRTEQPGPREALAADLGMSRDALEELVFSGVSGDRAQLGEISSAEHWENLRRRLGLAESDLQPFQDRFWSGDRVDWDLVAFIRSLRPSWKTALLSNAFSSLRHYITGEWQFDDAFDVIVISAEIGLVKPDARIYRYALEKLGVAPGEAVFIDDMPRNIQAAQELGMHTVHFKAPIQAMDEVNSLLDGGAR